MEWFLKATNTPYRRLIVNTSLSADRRVCQNVTKNGEVAARLWSSRSRCEAQCDAHLRCLRGKASMSGRPRLVPFQACLVIVLIAPRMCQPDAPRLRIRCGRDAHDELVSLPPSGASA